MEHFFRQRFVTLVVVVGGLVLLTILYFSYKNTDDLIDANEWIEHTQEVLLESEKLAMDVKNIQVNGRVFVITKDENMLEEFGQSERAAQARIQSLRDLVSDNPPQLAKADSLQALIEKHTDLETLLLTRSDLPAFFKESKAYEDRFLNALDSFKAEEYKLLAIRKQRGADMVKIFGWFLGCLVFVFGVLTVLVLVSVKRSERLQKRLVIRNEDLLATLKEVGDYKHALDESAIVAITDQRGVITHANDNFCRIAKYSREELIGQDHRIINSGYHSKDFFRQMWQTISSGKVWKGEIRNKAKDGQFYWVDTSIIPFLNYEGRPYQYLAIRFDITERKVAEDVRAANRRLEAEVHDKNAQLVDVLNRITEGFMILDKDFRYVYVNKKLCEMTRKGPDELLGKVSWDVFPETVGSPSYYGLLEVMDGTKEHVETMDYYPPLDLWHQNHVYSSENGVSVFVRDVSGQMQAERKMLETTRLYKTIASSIPGSVICILDGDLRYVMIEGDMIDKLGYIKHEVLEKRAKDALSKERFEEVEPYFRRALGGEAFSVEIRRGNYDLLTRYVPLPDEHGQVTMILVASFDVTQLKEAQRRVDDLNLDLEKKIEERTSQLEAANKELESFSYSIAHDLRSPLRGISGYAAMLGEDYSDKLDTEGNRLLSEIAYNASRMGRLIDDLLTFSRLGKKAVQKSVIDMKMLIDEVLRQLEPGKAKIRIEQTHPVLGDVYLIKSVVGNLLSNAIKYSGKEENPEVRISSVILGDMVTYSITDNGVGFNMERAGEMFGVFKRFHSMEEFEGTGVGLAIVQRIVVRHGGKVWAHSKVGEGATFFFTLPAIPTGETV
jgi:PAS domain S-box-containing protein